MPKPFANSQPITPSLISGDWLLGIQTGNSTGDNGLPQMKYIKLSQLTDWVRSNFGEMWRYRGGFSASLPSDPQDGDYFLATATFSVGADTYTKDHLYAYNTSGTWDDISKILTQYASQAQVTDIDDRLTAAEEKIDSMGDGITFKGECTYAELLAIADPQTGWEYWVTDENAFFIYSEEDEWVKTESTVTQEITEGDVSHSPSGDAVYNALEDEATAREAADSDLQSQIVNINGEIDNIEALIGDEAEVENTDPSSGSLLAQSRLIHHANLLPNGEFGRVGARATKWNQLFVPISSTTKYGLTFTVTDNLISISGTYDGTASYNEVEIGSYRTILANHVYVALTNPDLPSGVKIGLRGFGGGVYSQIKMLKHTANFYTTVILSFQQSLVGQSINITKMAVNWYDLTDKYGSTKADYLYTQTSAFVYNLETSLFPASYYPYDQGSIIPLNPEGFRIRGVNLWDEEWEQGYYDSTTGGTGSSTSQIRSKNKIPVTAGVTYYAKISGSNARVLYYDVNDNYLGSTIGTDYPVNNTTFTPPAGCVYARFGFGNTYGGTYNHDIQICLDSLPSSVKQEYHPYEGQIVLTPQIADGHYVNENVYDYVENVEEDGIEKGKFHDVADVIIFDGSPDENWAAGGQVCNYYIPFNNLVKANNYTGKILCNRLEAIASNLQQTSGNGIMSITGYYDSNNSYPNQNWFYIKVDETITSASALKTWLSNNPITVCFEKVTESVTNCEPLRSFGISDYSTIEPITPQTELVNRIDVPFSVKTKSANTLISRINQNTSDIATEVATRSAQVSALNKRVTNLELHTGDQFDVTYPSAIYGLDEVPSSVEPYAKVKELIMNSRVRNQLVGADNATSLTTFNNGIFTINATVDSSRTAVKAIPMTSGHKYLLCYTIKSGSLSDILRLYSSGYVDSFFGSTSKAWTFDCTTTGYYDINAIVSESTTINVSFTLTVTDLNIYFGGTIPTNASTIAQIQQNYPELLIPSDYDTGTRVDTTYSAVVSKGFNLLTDDNVELGTYDANGAEYPSSTGNWWRTADFVEVKPNTTYYAKIAKNYSTSNANIYAYFYDADGNFISRAVNIGNTAFPTPPNCYKMNLNYYFVTATLTAPTEMCLNISGSEDGTYKPYRDPVTLTLPTTVTGKSAGSVHQIYYPETGEMTEPIGEVNLGTISWAESATSVSGVNEFVSSGIASLVKKPANNATVANILCARYVAMSADATYNGALGICVRADGAILCEKTTNYPNASAFRTAMNGVMLYYERATPNPNSQATDPMPDPFIKLEAGGTIRPVQSQTTQIDSAMTVEYMAS